jgi:hypothetical protein
MSVEEHLRAAIADGDYKVDPGAVARAMIDKVAVGHVAGSAGRAAFSSSVLPPVQLLAPEYEQPFPHLDAA